MAKLTGKVYDVDYSGRRGLTQIGIKGNESKAVTTDNPRLQNILQIALIRQLEVTVDFDEIEPYAIFSVEVETVEGSNVIKVLICRDGTANAIVEDREERTSVSLANPLAQCIAEASINLSMPLAYLHIVDGVLLRAKINVDLRR